MYARTPYLESRNIPNPSTERLRGDTGTSALNNRSEMTRKGVKPHGVGPEGMSNHIDRLSE